MGKVKKSTILSEEQLNTLQEDKILLSCLSRFCNTTEEKLLDVLTIKNKKNIKKAHYINTKRIEHKYNYWYHNYFQKKWTKKRLISIPDPELKKVQENIKTHLQKIPVSLSSIWWGKWNNSKRNAELHAQNQYQISLDIKDAFPSINDQRVYKNLQGALGNKTLNLRFPYLKPEQKDLFLRAVTYLCTNLNKLPQGAPTSSHIQNIVMSEIDKKIEKLLFSLHYPNAKYSRYVDDMTVSFSARPTSIVLQEQCKKYITQLEDTLSLENIEEKKNSFKQIVSDIQSHTFTLTDKSEHVFLMDRSRNIINFFREKIENSEDNNEMKTVFSDLIDTLLKLNWSNIHYSWDRIKDIQKKLYTLLRNEWRKINPQKTKTRTPQSNTPRRVNKLVIDKENNIWIEASKKEAYMDVLTKLHKLTVEEVPMEMHKESFGKIYKNNDERIHQIISYLKGVRNYLVTVYWVNYFGEWKGMPKKLEEILDANLRKWKNYKDRGECYYRKKEQEESQTDWENSEAE